MVQTYRVNPEILRDYERTCLANVAKREDFEHWTVSDLCEFFGCDRSTVKRVVKKYDIKSYYVGHRYIIPRKSVIDFIRSRQGRAWIESRMRTHRMDLQTHSKLLKYAGLYTNDR